MTNAKNANGNRETQEISTIAGNYYIKFDQLTKTECIVQEQQYFIEKFY